MLTSMVEGWAEIQRDLDHLRTKAQTMRRLLKGYKPHLRAAQNLEKDWRPRGRMLPCCPGCGIGLKAEDFANGADKVGRDYGEKHRQHVFQERAARRQQRREEWEARCAAQPAGEDKPPE